MCKRSPFLGSIAAIVCVLASFSFAAEWHDFYFDAQQASKQKNWEKAIELYKKAIEVEPEPSAGKRFGMGKRRYVPYIELGLAYLGRGDIDSAHHACMQSKEKGVAPSKTVEQCLKVTSKFLGQPQSSSPTPQAPHTTVAPVITFTTAIPAETIPKHFDLKGVVRGSHGIKELKLTVENLGLAAITTFGMQKKDKEDFWITIPLDFGKNDVTLEAVDVKGYTGKQMFTIVRQTSTAQGQEVLPATTPISTDQAPEVLPTAIPTQKALQKETPASRPTSTPTPTQVKQLLLQADSYFDRQWFLTPQETNAFDTYKAVLQLAPENRHARERLHTIAQTYKRWGDNHFTDQDYEKAQTYYQRHLTIAMYLLEELDDQKQLPAIRQTQEQLVAIQSPPSPTPTEVIAAVPTPVHQAESTPPPSPAIHADRRPSIKLTMPVPEETDQETLTLEGVANDDIGVTTVNIRVEKPGTKGLTLVLDRQNHSTNRKAFDFQKLVSLFPGSNIIHIEAVDTTGQTGHHTLQIHRKMTSHPKENADVKSVPHRNDLYAVIVGIGQYQDERLNLRFTVNDAQGLYDILTNPLYGGVPKDHIKLLLNEEATDRNIKRAIGRWLSRQAQEDDTVLIYYSGHGAPEGRDTYWVTYNADIDDLYTTALNNSDIADMLDRIHSRRVITFLDSCYSAATVIRKNQTRSVPTEIPWKKFAGEGRVTISASDGKELSLELEEYRHGVFTYYLLEGLKGQADSNADGIVEVDEIWDYVKYQVKEKSREAGNPQTPVFQGAITAGIPLTYNKEHFEKKQHEKALQARQETLANFYEQGVIETETFICALNILNDGTSNRWLDDLLAGKITPQLFNRFFRCTE
ncbi:hypothetical protein CSA56_09100 [candidate division KSB3 bacterium]|uniref:Peptidase C14 caspase domain-containing protein n=1 Tax=candidate division KSB3 bacterium TaxID=2044937 RepID=A0A2G6KGD4_9BACT|nr:MAG: hypothetical protein CSA56_09100 [candidate division KSB3 bacterium]